MTGLGRRRGGGRRVLRREGVGESRTGGGGSNAVSSLGFVEGGVALIIAREKTM